MVKSKRTEMKASEKRSQCIVKFFLQKKCRTVQKTAENNGQQ